MWKGLESTTQNYGRFDKQGGRVSTVELAEPDRGDPNASYATLMHSPEAAGQICVFLRIAAGFYNRS